jgi:DNA-binding CsgD family transcriptional regulator
MTALGTVKTPALSGLPQFLSYASTFPSGELLLEALRSGPLARRRMKAGFIWMLVDGVRLMSIAQVGWGREMVDRYALIPMALDLPVVHSVTDNRPKVDPAPDFGSSYLSSIDERFLGEHFEALGAASIVNFPMRRANAVVGACGFVTETAWQEDDESEALLSALGSILGLWATHPRTASITAPASLGQRDWSLSFTPRQKEVLSLVGDGLPNSQIARRLMVSNSSVKQDLQHVMRALRTHDRESAYERAAQLNLLE